VTQEKLEEAIKKFKVYRTTYKAIREALTSQAGDALVGLQENTMVSNFAEKDAIYVKNIQLELTVTGQIHICHRIAVASDIEIDESRIEVEGTLEYFGDLPAIHYWLNIPWSKKETSETGTLSTGITIETSNAISSDFLKSIYPSLQEHETGWSWSETGNTLRVYVLLEPDLLDLEDAYPGIDLFNRAYPYKEKPVKVDTTPLAGVLAHPDYSEVMHQLEEHLATGMELKKKLQKLLEDPFAGGGWKNKGEEGQDA